MDFYLTQRRDFLREQAEREAEQAAAPKPVPVLAEHDRAITIGTDFAAAPLDRYFVLTLNGPDELAAVRADESIPLEFRHAAEALADIDGARCWRCGAKVGQWSATVGPSWHLVALVSGTAGPTPVNLQCTDCAPDVAELPYVAAADDPAGWGALVPPSCTESADGRLVAHATPIGGASCKCGQMQRFVPDVAGR